VPAGACDAVARLKAVGGDVGNVLEDFDEFLTYACPYDEGDGWCPGVP
jgi:hypothetical protein